MLIFSLLIAAPQQLAIVQSSVVSRAKLSVVLGAWGGEGCTPEPELIREPHGDQRNVPFALARDLSWVRLEKVQGDETAWRAPAGQALIAGLLVRGAVAALRVQAPNTSPMTAPCVDKDLTPTEAKRVVFPGVSFQLSRAIGSAAGRCRAVARIDKGDCQSLIHDVFTTEPVATTTTACNQREDLFDYAAVADDVITLIDVAGGAEHWLLLRGKQWERDFIWLLQMDRNWKLIQRYEAPAGGC